MLRDENTWEGLAYYKYAEFVIGMRGHAQICPIGLGVPIISLISHAKHTGLLDRLGLPPYMAKVSEPGFGGQLIEFSQIVEAEHESIVRQYRATLTSLRELARQFIEPLGVAFQGEVLRSI